MLGIMINTAAERLSNSEYSIMYSRSPPHSAEHIATPYLKTGRRQRTAITSPAASILRFLNTRSAETERIRPTAQ